MLCINRAGILLCYQMVGYQHYGPVGADWTFVVGEKEKRLKAQKKDEETEELIKIFFTSIKTAVRQAHGPERSRRAEKKQK